MEDVVLSAVQQSMVDCFLDVAVGVLPGIAISCLKATRWQVDDALQMYFVGIEHNASDVVSKSFSDEQVAVDGLRSQEVGKCHSIVAVEHELVCAPTLVSSRRRRRTRAEIAAAVAGDSALEDRAHIPCRQRKVNVNAPPSPCVVAGVAGPCGTASTSSASVSTRRKRRTRAEIDAAAIGCSALEDRPDISCRRQKLAVGTARDSMLGNIQQVAPSRFPLTCRTAPPKTKIRRSRLQIEAEGGKSKHARKPCAHMAIGVNKSRAASNFNLVTCQRLIIETG